MVFLSICAALLLASQANAGDNRWNVRANNKQDAMGQSNGFGASGPNDGQLMDMWSDFKQTYGKSYASPSEEAQARNTFKANMRDVFKTNQDPNSPYWATGNKFSDQDSTQRGARLMQFNPLTENRKLAEGAFIPEPPPRAPEPGEEGTGGKRRLLQSSVDWRAVGKVPAIRDQGNCGSCWAFAATATIESAYLIAKGLTAGSSPALDLSEQQMVSCATKNAGYNSGGCNGGYSDHAMRYVMDRNQTTEEKYAYASGTSGSTGSCLSSVLGSTTPGQVVQLAVGPVYYTRNSESALRAAVDKQPVVIYFMVASSFYSYAGGIYKPTDCTTSINHAMVVVGYSYTGNPATDYWIVRNSWGIWGDQGYIKITMDGSSAGPCGMYTFNVAPSFSYTKSLTDTIPPPSPSPSPRPPPPSPRPPSPSPSPRPPSPSPSPPRPPSPPSKNNGKQGRKHT